jgi:hypothetical protein
MFDGNLQLALAAYNAGEGAVRQYKNAIPPYPETQQYVRLVLQFYDYFAGHMAQVKHLADGRIRVTLRPRTDAAAIAEQLCVAQLERDPRVRAMSAPALLATPALQSAGPSPAVRGAPDAAPSPAAPVSGQPTAQAGMPAGAMMESQP